MAGPDDQDTEKADLFGSLMTLIGSDALFRLIERYGGIRLYIPLTAKPESRIAQTIGLDAAQALAAEYGGILLAFPMAKAWRIQVYRQRGMSYAAISRAVGVHEATVHRQLAAMGLTGQGMAVRKQRSTDTAPDPVPDPIGAPKISIHKGTPPQQLPLFPLTQGATP